METFRGNRCAIARLQALLALRFGLALAALGLAPNVGRGDDAAAPASSSTSGVSLSPAAALSSPSAARQDQPSWPYAALAGPSNDTAPELVPLPPVNIPSPSVDAITAGAPEAGSSSGGLSSLAGRDGGASEGSGPPKLLGIALDEDQWDLMRYAYYKVVDGVELGVVELFYDYGNLISYRSLSFLGLSLATAGAMANTPFDQHVTDWSDQHIKSPTSDRIAQDFKMLGNGGITIPIFVVAAFSGPFLEDSTPVMGPIGQWGNRSIQAMLAAGPMEVFLNQALGSSRPVAGEGSKWRPFHDSHGVSGHAFMGAIPFLTVASMTDSVGVKVVMFLLSWGAGWSRINDDMHYASEVFMGWSLGFMGVDAVTRTKSGKNNFLFSPAILAGGTPGVQLAFNF